MLGIPLIHLKEVRRREAGHRGLDRARRLHIVLSVELPDVACRGGYGRQPATRRGAHDREAVRVDVIFVGVLTKPANRRPDVEELAGEVHLETRAYVDAGDCIPSLGEEIHDVRRDHPAEVVRKPC